MRDDKAIPWSRISAESVAIIVSILAAFAIDAWWDLRQTVAEESELLAALETGLAENAERAALAIERAADDRALLQSFVAMTPDEAERIASDATWPMLRSLWRPHFATLNSAGVIATLESYPTLLRARPELRSAVANWRGAIERLASATDRLTVSYGAVVNALAVYPELQPAFAELEGSRLISGAVARRIREDNEVMRRAVEKGFATQIQILALTGVETSAARALAILREES